MRCEEVCCCDGVKGCQQWSIYLTEVAWGRGKEVRSPRYQTPYSPPWDSQLRSDGIGAVEEGGGGGGGGRWAVPSSQHQRETLWRGRGQRHTGLLRQTHTHTHTHTHTPSQVVSCTNIGITARSVDDGWE